MLSYQDYQDEVEIRSKPPKGSSAPPAKNLPKELLPFEKEKHPRDWSEREKEEWLEAYDGIIKSAIYPYRKLVYITCMDMDDLYQTAVCVVLNCFERYDENTGTKLSTFCYRSIVNELISKFRAVNSQKRKGEISAASLDYSADDSGRAESPRTSLLNMDLAKDDGLRCRPCDVETQVEQRLLMEKILEVLNTGVAKEMDREIFLRCVSGESQLDIADDYSIPQTTVCSINRRVRTMLRNYFNRNGYLDSPSCT